MKQLLVAVLYSLIMVAAATPLSAGSKCSDPGTLCVGLVTDVGVIDDKSFNQSAWEGLELARKTLGAKIKYIETRDAKDYKKNIELFAKNGYDVIVTVGFGLGEATKHAAAEHPDIKFIGLDQFQVTPVPNIAGLIFREDIGGFKAGALAAMLSKSGTIASVFATDMIPPIVAFKNGFQNGARYINPDIRVISSYHPGGLDVSFTDPEWGASTARQAIAQGADVVFGAGGLTGNGALIETASHTGTFCIGVDTDQWETVPAARPCLVSSALKKITPAVLELINHAGTNTFPSGNYFGDVGLAPFHSLEKAVTAEMRTRLAEIETGLSNGSIKP